MFDLQMSHSHQIITLLQMFTTCTFSLTHSIVLLNRNLHYICAVETCTRVPADFTISFIFASVTEISVSLLTRTFAGSALV